MSKLKKIQKAANEGFAFARSTYGKVKTKLMTPRDMTEGGKYKVERIGNQLYRSKVKPK